MHFDGLFFILLVGAAAVLRWLSQRGDQKSNGTNEQTPGTPPRNAPPVRSGAAGSEEDRIRRFLEALGQPTSATPPRKVQPRPVTVATAADKTRDEAEKARRALRKPVWTNPLPPLTTAPPPPPPPFAAPAAVVPKVIVTTPRQAAASAPVARIRSATTATTQPDTASAFAGLFGSPARLREAIVLREIFGPPRGLQAPETF
jgi:hypothetical protein